MNILMVTMSMQIGGAETHVLELSRALVKMGHKVTVASKDGVYTELLREAGITAPVIPGIMPITNGNQVERAIKLSGSLMPQRFKALVDKFGTTPAAMKQAGIAYATDQIIDLFANGIKNVHVYSMNKPDVAAAIQQNLSDILR